MTPEEFRALNRDARAAALRDMSEADKRALAAAIAPQGATAPSGGPRDWDRDMSKVRGGPTNEAFVNAARWARDESGKAALAGLNAFTDTMALGQADELAAAIGAPFRALLDRTSPNQAYRDNLAPLEEARRINRENSPFADAAGVGVGLAAGPVKWAMEAGESAFAQGAMGGLEGYSFAAGDPDTRDNAGMWGALGAALGAGGSLAVRGGRAVKDFFSPSADVINRDLAEGLAGDMTRRGIDGDIGGLTDEVKDYTMGADLFRDQVAGAITQGASDDAIGNLSRALARPNRDVIGQTDGTMLDIFGDPQTKAVSAEVRRATREGYANQYESALAARDADPDIDVNALVEMLDTHFDNIPIASRALARNKIQAMIDAKGMLQPGQSPGDPSTYGRQFITLRDADEIKRAMDNMIDYAAPGQPVMIDDTPVSPDVQRAVRQMRRELDTMLKTDDEYAAAVANYAGDAELTLARKAASRAIKTPNKELTREVSDLYEGLSEAAKEEFRMMAVYELALKVQTTGDLARIAGQKGGSSTIDTIRSVFGDETAAGIIREADRIGTIKATADAIETARAARSRSSVGFGEATDPLQFAVDAFTLGTQTVQGRVFGGPAQGSAKRSIRHLGKSAPADVNTARVNFGAKQGDELESALRELSLLRSGGGDRTPYMNLGVLMSGGAPSYTSDPLNDAMDAFGPMP